MLRAGLIGLPATGKTTLFQLLTRGTEATSSRKFGRADAQIGIATVPDPRLDLLTALFKPRKHVPATVTVADVGANAGTALGDLAAYREANALLHVVRAFRAEDVPHSQGAVDPLRDARSMEDELVLTDLAVAERRLERIEQDRRKGVTAALQAESNLLERCRQTLEAGAPLRSLALERTEEHMLRGFQFLSAKPLLLVVNVDEADVASTNEIVSSLVQAFGQHALRVVPICAKIELEIAQLDPADARAFLTDLGLTEPGLERVIQATYALLGYISFFTVGEDECRAWSIATGTNAQTAAGEIHTDIARGFIRAEVVPHDTLLNRGSIAACREHGEVRLEGKEYVVTDGDVINFRFAT